MKPELYNEDEMIQYFITRTNLHIKLVGKYLDKIAALDILSIESSVLKEEKALHDHSKFEEPELTPYIFLSWRYLQKETNKDFDYPESVQNAITEATMHHIKNNHHHPESWSDQTQDLVNPNNRDAPPKKIVDATKMPHTFIACMVADWLAMSEEKGTDPYEWVKKNVNIRWEFTPEQVKLINYLIDAVWEG